MDREQFWATLDRTRVPGDPDAHETRLAEALAGLPPNELVDFQRHAESLLSASFGNRLWGAGYLINGGCSDDGFDYFRAWVVAQGRAVFEAALADPDSLAGYADLGDDGDVELEGLWYVARQAYEKQTGAEMPDLDLTEIGSEEDDDFDFDDEDEMKRRFPRLYVRFVDDAR